MKKKIIGLLIGIFLIGLVGAITLGQIITQEQLDNTDLDNVDLECQREGEPFLIEDGGWKIRQPYSCFQIVPLDSGNYNVTRLNTYEEYPVNAALECLETHTVSWCVENRIKPHMKQMAKMQIDNIRDTARSYQTSEEFIIPDLNLTDDDFDW